MLDFIVITDILQNHLLPHVGTSYKQKLKFRLYGS